MKRKHNGGYSLIEVLIAMAVLGIITIPTTSALLTAHRMNVKAENMMVAQLNVSSAIETLMAEGISAEYEKNTTKCEGVEITAKLDPAKSYYYNVTVTSTEDESVSITTQVRAVTAPSGGDAE